MTAMAAGIDQRIEQRRGRRAREQGSETYFRVPGGDARPSEPFHDAWRAHAGAPRMVRLARAIVGQWLGSRLIIGPDDRIVGRMALQSIVTWSFSHGVRFDQGLWERELAQGDARRRAYLEVLSRAWQHRATDALVAEALTPTERAVTSVHSLIGPGCHAAPLFVRLAAEGTSGLRHRVRLSREAHLGEPGTEPAEWYEGYSLKVGWSTCQAEN